MYVTVCLLHPMNLLFASAEFFFHIFYDELLQWFTSKVHNTSAMELWVEAETNAMKYIDQGARLVLLQEQDEICE